MGFVYNQSPAYLVGLLSRLFSQAMSTRLASHEVSPAQFPVLLCLWQKDGQTQSEICRRIHVEQPTLSNTLQRMVRDRLIRKEQDSNDRRQIIIKLTKRGKALKPILVSSALEVHHLALKGLQEQESNDFVRLINMLIMNLESDISEDPLLLENAIDCPLQSAQNMKNNKAHKAHKTHKSKKSQASQEVPRAQNTKNNKAHESNKSKKPQSAPLVLRDIDIVRE